MTMTAMPSVTFAAAGRLLAPAQSTVSRHGYSPYRPDLPAQRLASVMAGEDVAKHELIRKGKECRSRAELKPVIWERNTAPLGSLTLLATDESSDPQRHAAVQALLGELQADIGTAYLDTFTLRSPDGRGVDKRISSSERRHRGDALDEIVYVTGADQVALALKVIDKDTVVEATKNGPVESIPVDWSKWLRSHNLPNNLPEWIQSKIVPHGAEKVS